MSWINSKCWMKVAEKINVANPDEKMKAPLCFATRLFYLMRKGLIPFPSSEDTQETANNLASQLKTKKCEEAKAIISRTIKEITEQEFDFQKTMKCEELKAMISNTIYRAIEKITEQGSKIPRPFPCVSEKMMTAALNHYTRGGCKSGAVKPVSFSSSSTIASLSAVPTNTCPENLLRLQRQLGEFFQKQLNEVAKPQTTESPTLPKKYVHAAF